jgi:hypothetical protein
VQGLKGLESLVMSSPGVQLPFSCPRIRARTLSLVTWKMRPFSPSSPGSTPLSCTNTRDSGQGLKQGLLTDPIQSLPGATVPAVVLVSWDHGGCLGDSADAVTNRPPHPWGQDGAAKPPQEQPP